MAPFVTTLLLPLLLPLATAQEEPNQPHVVVIMTDDMGFNDVGFREKQMVTPNIDKLARDGVVMNQAYMLKSCTPSRSSFLSGVYAYRLGLQHSSLHAAENYSLPLSRRTYAQELQDNGYSTHYVGKWHLGFCKPEMTPTYRGYNTFYGTYNGEGDYFTHISKWEGYDLQDNKGTNQNNWAVDWAGNNVYSTFLFTNRSLDIIKKHDTSKPLHLLLSYQAVHGPLQYPPEYLEKCSHVEDITYEGLYDVSERRMHCALTVPMDEGIGQVRQALKDRGMDKNLILLFISDNGGALSKGASNWPLRGGKITEWEGGTRVVSILHSDKYLKKNVTWNGLMHAVDWAGPPYFPKLIRVVDWYPTLLGMAGIKTNNTDIDGVNSWDRIVKQEISKRTEFVYNINEVKDNYSFRWMQYKLINFAKASPDGWFFPPPGEAAKPIQQKDYKTKKLLFDLSTDESEENPFSERNKTHKCIIKDMWRQITKYKKRLLPTLPKFKLDRANPITHFNGAWSTGWC
ncbi:hypothetical protein ACOMHN_017769 [Nucella lapillus]